MKGSHVAVLCCSRQLRPQEEWQASSYEAVTPAKQQDGSRAQSTCRDRDCHPTRSRQKMTALFTLCELSSVTKRMFYLQNMNQHYCIKDLSRGDAAGSTHPPSLCRWRTTTISWRTHAERETSVAGTTRTLCGWTRTEESHITTWRPRRSFPGVAPPAPQRHAIWKQEKSSQELEPLQEVNLCSNQVHLELWI